MRVNRRVRRAVLAVAAVVIGLPAGLYGWRSGVEHNFGTVQTGRVFRSAQMGRGPLEAAVRGRKIKTVLNLRGPNAGKSWYRDERAAVLGSGATLVDVPLSSCDWMSRPQLRTVVRVLDTSDYPVLIHCQHGSERTGWVSAVATLLRPGSTLKEAEAQFAVGYLFFGLGDGKVMAEHLDQYEAWLSTGHLTHSPAHFRRWVDEGFRPGRPSREDWPYDPCPLVVITRPAPPATTSRHVAGAAGVDREGVRR